MTITAMMGREKAGSVINMYNKNVDVDLRIETQPENPRCPAVPLLAIRRLASLAADLIHGEVSQPVTRHGPEDEGQGCDTCGDEHANPYCATDEQLLHVRLFDAKGTEWGRLGLAEEDQNRIKLVLMGD